MKLIRTFIAIELDPTTQTALEQIQITLKRIDADVKWVKPSNIHLTLRFLGNIRRKKLKSLQQDFPQLFKEFTPFEVQLTHLGAFPKLEHPKIIWAGIDDKNGKINKLAKKVENYLCTLGLPKEKKKFSPHLTLARLRSSKNLSLFSQALKEYPFPPTLIQNIHRISLFQSTLTSQGPVYEPLVTVEL